MGLLRELWREFGVKSQNAVAECKFGRGSAEHLCAAPDIVRSTNARGAAPCARRLVTHGLVQGVRDVAAMEERGAFVVRAGAPQLTKRHRTQHDVIP